MMPLLRKFPHSHICGHLLTIIDMQHRVDPVPFIFQAKYRNISREI